MTEFAGGGRSRIHGRRTGSQVHSTAAVVLLVAITVASVFLARGFVFWGGAAAATFWVAFAAIAMAGLLRWVSTSRFYSVSARQEPGVSVGSSRRAGKASPADARRHRRFVPARRATTLITYDGRQIPARIVDISIAGVAIEARLTDADMTAVTRVGSRDAGPIRRTLKGAVFGFDILLEPQPFDASFTL